MYYIAYGSAIYIFRVMPFFIIIKSELKHWKHYESQLINYDIIT